MPSFFQPARASERRERASRLSARPLALVLVALVVAIAGSASIASGQADFDGDGVLDDGDGSGSAYDNPCPDGGGVGCDDNCRTVANPTQTDVSPPFGVGDACQEVSEDDITEFFGNGQQTDQPFYRWREVAASFEPLEIAKTRTLDLYEEDGGECFFVDIVPFDGPRVNFDEPIAPPYGGLACCPWEAKCNLRCVQQGNTLNDCDVSVDCEDDQFDATEECSLILWGTEDFVSLTPQQREAIGLALQDANGPCASVPKVPYDSCCFRYSKNVPYYWGSERGHPDSQNPPDSDNDGHADACDICPTIPNTVQLDGDGDGRGDLCDEAPANRWRCGDTDDDTCDDCSWGSFDPSFDGNDNPANGICIPEPGSGSMLVAGLAMLAGLVRRRGRAA